MNLTITRAGEQALPTSEGDVYLLVQHRPDVVIIAKTFGPMPLEFRVKHAPACQRKDPIGICPCKPPAVAEAITDLDGNTLWHIGSPPTLVPNDGLTFDWGGPPVSVRWCDRTETHGPHDWWETEDRDQIWVCPASTDKEVLAEVMTPDLQEKFEDEVFAAHRAKIMEVFGITQADLDVLENATGYRAAKERAEAERAAYLSWVGEVYSRLSEPMDPHVDLGTIIDYMAGKVEWDALNSPEQAQVMDWRLR